MSSSNSNSPPPVGRSTTGAPRGGRTTPTPGTAQRLPPRTRSGGKKEGKEGTPRRARALPGRSKSMNLSGNISRATSRRGREDFLDQDFDTGMSSSARISSGSSSRYARYAVASTSTTNLSATRTTAMRRRNSLEHGPREQSPTPPGPSDQDLMDASAASLGGVEEAIPMIPMTTAGSKRHLNLHNSTLARRFLKDDSEDSEDDDYNIPTSAAMNRSTDFHMSQLQFPTVTPGMFDDDSERPTRPPTSRFLKPTGRFAQQQQQPQQSVFASRQDLREVDQSVNLMDVDAGTYESGRNSGRGRGRISHGGSRPKRQSMVDIFLGEQATTDSNFLKAPKKHGRSSLYRDDDYDTCWERFTDTCQLFFKMLCSWPVLILAMLVGAGMLIVPPLLEAHPGADVVPATTTTKEEPKTTPPTVAAPTAAPTGETTALVSASQVEARTRALQDILEAHDLDPAKVSLLALNWMAAYDPAMMAIVDAAPVLERFAMAAFYFAMNPDVDAADVVPLDLSSSSAASSSEERQAGRNLQSTEWMSSAAVCDWPGIDCQDQQVIHLNVSHTHLQGSLPEELTLLKGLLELDLSHNLIHGTFPASYPTKLSNLEYVWLHVNQIGGSLPATIGDWGTVYHLDLSENQLTGSLPSSLAKLTQTRLMYLHQNKLKGSIPLELGHLPEIEYLYLGQNQLTGELPMDLLSTLSTIVDLRLEDNELTGTVPPEIESLHRLEFLYLGNNKLHGELPDVFDRLHYIVEMDLRENSFGGTIPETLGKATYLQLLQLEGNKLSGSIPTSWLQLTELEKLGLDHNSLSGEMPLCSLEKLSFVAADCKSKIKCDCCEKCY